VSLRSTPVCSDNPGVHQTNRIPHQTSEVVIVVCAGRLGLQVDGTVGCAPATAPSRRFAREPGERLAPVLASVAACPTDDHSAAAMADRIGVSVRHLGRLFAQQLAVTPARHVELVRIAAAKALLTGTRAPLAEVATQAGFGSAETMRRAFLRTVGVTPGTYRQRPDGRSI
jgi:transcriptional regulator GlxA family with amidase domain